MSVIAVLSYLNFLRILSIEYISNHGSCKLSDKCSVYSIYLKLVTICEMIFLRMSVFVFSTSSRTKTYFKLTSGLLLSVVKR